MKQLPLILMTILLLLGTIVQGQESNLEEQKTAIYEEEKNALKSKVKQINETFELGGITKEEAEKRKSEVATYHAEKIKKRVADLENGTMASDTTRNKRVSISVGGKNKDGDDSRFKIIINNDDSQNDTISIKKDKKYNRAMQFFKIGFGVNTTITGNQSDINSSPYNVWKSNSFEIGSLHKIRLIKKSNFVKLNVGYSLLWNRYSPEGNQYFVKDEEQTNIEVFEGEVIKSKLSQFQLYVPLGLEFNLGKNKYRFNNGFSFGAGAYMGFNMRTKQKLKISVNGDKDKRVDKDKFNTNTFVYGLYGEIGYESFRFYGKIQMNPLFNNNPVNEFPVHFGVIWQL